VVTPAEPASAGPLDAPGTDERVWASWLRLSEFPVADITTWRSAVVLAAHPDDEVLGAGGILSLLSAAGVRLRLVAVTDGGASHPGHPALDSLARRRSAETLAALRILGAADAEVARLGLPDAGLDSRIAEIAARLAGLADGFDICLAPWEGDIHPDHEAVGRAARIARLPLMSYPIWMWHWSFPADPRVPWHRALRVPLRPAAAARKRLAIRCFGSQLEDRGGGTGPVLTAGTVAHFTRETELLFR
jgi:LmbE family N-acetylglucosaminyl deacetylase